MTDLDDLDDETPLARITLGNIRDLLAQTDRQLDRDARVLWWTDRVIVPALIVALAIMVAVIVLALA